MLKIIPKQRSKVCTSVIAVITFFAAFFTPTIAGAADQTADIDGLKTAAAIETAIETAITAAGNSGTITVTGTPSGNTTSDVTLNIPEGITVIWKASIKLLSSGCLNIAGAGTFEVTTGGEVNQRINAIGTNSIILVSGGSVGGVVLTGENSAITVSGGTVSTSSTYRAIDAAGTNSKITICGSGRVQSSVMSIRAVNIVEIKDNAVVSITGSNTAIYGEENSIIDVSGGTITSVSGSAIVNNGANCKVMLSGGTITSNTGRAISINSSSSASTITISGNAKIIRTTTTNISEAIYNPAGSVEVKDNAEINVSGGAGINAAIVTVGGGTIYAASDAISSSNANAKITISGGLVKSGTGNAINADGTNSQVIISGNAKVQGSSYGNAIRTKGSVEVKDNAEVSSSTTTIAATGASSKVTVSGGTISNNFSGNSSTVTTAISVSGANSAIIISGGTVSSNFSRTISATGTNSTVTVSGGMVHTNSNNQAIYVTQANSKITISGGTVFAYDPVMLVDNVNNFTGVSGTGVVIAWDQKTGNTSYVKGSVNDLSTLPAGCAKWDIVSGENGISYENGTNKGFIAIDDISVSGGSGITAAQTGQLHVYPNPAANYITISGLQANETLYFYDVSGIQLFSLKTTNDTERVAVNHLPSGIYFVKTSNGKMLKWIKN